MSSKWVCCQCTARSRDDDHCDWLLHREPYSRDAEEAAQEQWSSSFDDDYAIDQDEGDLLVFCAHERCDDCQVWHPQPAPQPQPQQHQRAMARPGRFQPAMYPQPPPWLWPPQPRSNLPRVANTIFGNLAAASGEFGGYAQMSRGWKPSALGADTLVSPSSASASAKRARPADGPSPSPSSSNSTSNNSNNSNNNSSTSSSNAGPPSKRRKLSAPASGPGLSSSSASSDEEESEDEDEEEEDDEEEDDDDEDDDSAPGSGPSFGPGPGSPAPGSPRSPGSAPGSSPGPASSSVSSGSGQGRVPNKPLLLVRAGRRLGGTRRRLSFYRPKLGGSRLAFE